MAELAKALRRFFVNREDTYCVQTSHGYKRIDEPLGDAVIESHLRGELTVGSYQLNKQNLVKYLCFDIDPEKLQSPDETARKILKILFETKKNVGGEDQPRVWQHNVLLEASRHPDPSYHIWVLFFIPVQAKVARWLGYRILKLANMSPKNVEVFPKQTKITPERPYGNFVKLPFGFHQVEKKWSKMLDFISFKPISFEELDNKHGLSLSQKDLVEIEGFEPKTAVQTSFTLPEHFEPLNKEQELKAVAFLCKYWREGLRNQLTMYYCGLALKQGVSLESAKRVIAEVTARTQDTEASSRLKLVEYHYRTRTAMPLKGLAGIQEVIAEVEADE